MYIVYREDDSIQDAQDRPRLPDRGTTGSMDTPNIHSWYIVYMYIVYREDDSIEDARDRPRLPDSLQLVYSSLDSTNR